MIYTYLLTPNHNDMHDDTFNKDDWRWFEHLHWKTNKKKIFIFNHKIHFFLLLFHKFSIFMTIFLFIYCLSKCFNSFYFFFAVLSSSNRDCYWKCLYGRSHSCKRQGKKKKIFEYFLTPYNAYEVFCVLLTCFLENYCDLWHVSLVNEQRFHLFYFLDDFYVSVLEVAQNIGWNVLFLLDFCIEMSLECLQTTKK